MTGRLPLKKQIKDYEWLFRKRQIICFKQRNSFIIPEYLRMYSLRKSFFLIQMRNNNFPKLEQKFVLSKEELKYFTFQYRKSANLEKLPKIHKRTSLVPGSLLFLIVELKRKIYEKIKHIFICKTYRLSPISQLYLIAPLTY